MIPNPGIQAVNEPFTVSNSKCTCKLVCASSLYEAACNGCLRCCFEHIREAEKLVDGTTALIKAIKGSHADISRILLPYERDIKDRRGWKPKHYAFHTNDIEIWRLFKPDITLEDGIRLHSQALSVCICDDPGESLIDAAKKNCFCCCARLEHQAGQIVSNSTAMMEAAKSGNVDIVKLLTLREAQIQNQWGQTALIFAAEHGHAQVVKLLMNTEARMQDKLQRTALMEAARNDHLDVVKLLMPIEKDVKDHKNRSIVTFAARSQDEPILNFVLRDMHPDACAHIQEARAALCTCDAKSHNLKSAASNGCLRCSVNFLQEVGQYFYEPGDTSNGPALCMAARFGHTSIVRLLIPFEAGACNENTQRTALMEAAAGGHIETLHELIPHEAGTVQQGMTALAHAVSYHRRECFDILRQSREEFGASKIQPFMLAVYNGRLRVALEETDAWNSIFEDGLNVLEFALLRDRQTWLRALTRGPEAIAKLARYGQQMQENSTGMAMRLLRNFDSQRFFSQILEVVCAVERKGRSKLITEALFSHGGDAARALRPFCTPMRASWEETVRQQCNKATLIVGFKTLKNIGIVWDIDELIDDLRMPGQNRTYIESNPLKQKQLALAKKQIDKQYAGFLNQAGNEEQLEEQRWQLRHLENAGIIEVQDEHNFGWRETDAESCFNCSILLETRALWWATVMTPRAGPQISGNTFEAYLKKSAIIIRDIQWYFYGKVKEMLAE